MLVVLDLDETLVHAPDRLLARAADFYAASQPVYLRPGARHFVSEVLAQWQVGVWTSASASYATLVVDALFGAHAAALQFVWSSSRCSLRFNHEAREYESVKNLHKLRRRGFPLESTIVVDDTPSKHIRNYGNLVAVRPWIGDLDDGELAGLLPYLKELALVDNVRTIEKRGWQRGRVTRA